MPRPNRTDQRRKELIPIIAKAFAELGYRRTTTAKLAQRCQVRENILYRLWRDKKAMFVAAIDHVYQQSADTWQRILSEADDETGPAERLLAYEARHYGESGLHPIIFAGLSETNEPQIREAMENMYSRFHGFIRQQITAHRKHRGGSVEPDAALCAWAIVGLGNVANISRELGLLTGRGRERLFSQVGSLLLGGSSA